MVLPGNPPEPLNRADFVYVMLIYFISRAHVVCRTPEKTEATQKDLTLLVNKIIANLLKLDEVPDYIKSAQCASPPAPVDGT